MDFEQRLRELDQNLSRSEGRRDAIAEQIASQERKEQEWQERDEIVLKAIEVLQAASETRRQELKDRVESLVTRGLRAVFNADLEFFFHIAHNRDVMTVTPRLRSKFKGKDLETEIVEGHGGGIADVVSFLLKVIVLVLARPRMAPFLALDEPFRHVSGEYLKGCATLLKELNKTAGIQFLIVTHKPELLDSADNVYRTEKDAEGATVFKLEHDLDDGAFHAPQPRGAKSATMEPFHGQNILLPMDGKFTLSKMPVEDELAMKQRGTLKMLATTRARKARPSNEGEEIADPQTEV